MKKADSTRKELLRSFDRIKRIYGILGKEKKWGTDKADALQREKVSL
jgi:hypothetical protein